MPYTIEPSFPDYKIIRQLGKESMQGEVYLATHKTSGESVAIKTLKSELFHDPKSSQKAVLRFQREGDIGTSLSHPNIIRIISAGQLPLLSNREFICMEYLAGGSFEDCLHDFRKPAVAANVLWTVANAVHFLHQHGIIHRDLKPANVLFASDLKPVVTDFGYALRLDDERITSHGASVGTIAYASPEQLCDAHKVTAVTDVYSLGVILYELTAVRLPFNLRPGEKHIMFMERLLGEDPMPPSFYAAGVPAALDEICMKCLKKKPCDRYATAAEFAAALHQTFGPFAFDTAK